MLLQQIAVWPGALGKRMIHVTSRLQAVGICCSLAQAIALQFTDWVTLNVVICCMIDWTFSSTPKSLGGITVITLKTLRANYMLIRLLYAYIMTD